MNVINKKTKHQLPRYVQEKLTITRNKPSCILSDPSGNQHKTTMHTIDMCRLIYSNYITCNENNKVQIADPDLWSNHKYVHQTFDFVCNNSKASNYAEYRCVHTV